MLVDPDIIGDAHEELERSGSKRLFGYLQSGRTQCISQSLANRWQNRGHEWSMTKRKKVTETCGRVIIAQYPNASKYPSVYPLPLYSYTMQDLKVSAFLLQADSKRQDRDTSDTDPADRQRFCQSRRVEDGRSVRGAIGGGMLC
jgi:hypothetical protein